MQDALPFYLSPPSEFQQGPALTLNNQK